MVKEKEKIARAPIMLNDRDVIVIQLFHRDNDFEDLWMTDYWNHMVESADRHSQAAEQFVSQLKGHWCIAFMEALIKECFKESMHDTGAGNFEWQRELIQDLTKLMGFPIVADNEPEKWNKIIEKYNEQTRFEKMITNTKANTQEHFQKWLQDNFKAPELK